MKTFVIALFAVAMPLAAQLQLSSLDGLGAKAKESAEITLDAATLKLAGGLLGNDKGDKDKAKVDKVLANLKSITVRAYEFAKAGQYDVNILRPIRDQLRTPGWSKMMDLKDPGGETFELYSKTEQGRISGFAMLATESNALTVIHIEGSLDLADVASLGGQFGIPELPLLDQNKKGKE